MTKEIPIWLKVFGVESWRTPKASIDLGFFKWYMFIRDYDYPLWKKLVTFFFPFIVYKIEDSSQK